MLRRLASALLDPMPYRVTATRWAIRKFKFGSYRDRLRIDATARPHYGYCVYHAALQARALGLRRISAIEFGVAGGNGLLDLEDHAAEIERETGVACDVYGFDTGRGLPPPTDLRDLPYLWREGFYAMDVDMLSRRLRDATLVLGDVAETVPTFFDRYNPAPIGAVMLDLDLYSSTAAALAMFRGRAEALLPRVLFYFDDVTGGPAQAYSEYAGELLAVHEFNSASAERKFGRLSLETERRYRAPWNERIYVLHSFDHPHYASYVGPQDDQRPLAAPSTPAVSLRRRPPIKATAARRPG